jgi:gamma-glutamyltranspeptidase/glutathione hydrolase
MKTHRRAPFGWWFAAVAGAMLGTLPAAVDGWQAAPAGQPAAGVSHSAVFARYAVAADHPLASRAGAEVLAAGGNAVDAAVATSFALSVVRPFSCGIGGGGFMLVHLREDPPAETSRGAGMTVAINYREMTPAAIGPEFFEDKPAKASTVGGLAVGVPGTVAGLLSAHVAHGKLERAAVLAPAIRLAREGFAVDEAYAKAAADAIKDFEAEPALKHRFAFTWERFLGGGSVKVGDVIRLPEQAAALELIARDGVDAFYRGAIAEAIVRAVKADGGVLTLEDLRAYQVESGAPIVSEFAGMQVLGMPPPSSGGIAVAQVLGILERAKLGALAERFGSKAPPYSALIAEAFKHAFADRARWLGDGSGGAALAEKLLDPAYLDRLASRTAVGRTRSPSYYGSGWTTDEEGNVIPEDGGTSHLSVIDAEGHAVACTETINLGFGSYLAVPEFGFLLNNQMDDFTTRRGQANAFGLRQSDANRPAPGKRPLSSMSPTIVREASGEVVAVAGASGGPRIITGTVQALLNALVLKLPAGEAVSRGRLHHQWQPNVVYTDARLAEEREAGLSTPEWLRKSGHIVKPMTSESAVQLIVRRPAGEQGPRVLEAASDPRKGGAPAGE